ncbi:MAG: hypothetical protein K0S27_288 [Gammaproteobacteria bacterium]|jgi:hypothetical protein|nr:hypothetical protein [Gammaproteobacteria bacterium]
MNKIFTYALIFIFLSFSLPALSGNFAFLYDTPAQYFGAQDWKMLEATANYALNKLPNGKSAKWQNPKTSHHGIIKPLNSIKKQGILCRDLQITNYAQHRSDQYVFMFCKFHTGWKVPNKQI